MFNRFIYRREWSFRIYRETLSRFSCAASLGSWAIPDALSVVTRSMIQPSAEPEPSRQRPAPSGAHRRRGS
ncbi:hypothetical protein ABLN67_11890 [Mycobacterium tuberculosis]